MDLLMPFLPNSIPLTPINFLERAAIAYSGCPSLVYHTNNTCSYTWEQTHRRCVQTASSMNSLGIKRGDVVSVLAPNVPAMYELQFSIPMAGAILNNINTRLDPRTLSVLLRHSECKMIFVEDFLRPLLFQALELFPPGTSRPQIVVIRDVTSGNGTHLSYDKNLIIKNDVGDCNSDGDAAYVRNNIILGDYEEVVEGGDSSFKWVWPKSEWDPIALNYTSGTTSNPKGVVLSHRGNYLLAINTLLGWSVPEQPTYLWTLPMFHANGWSLTWGMAAVGATNICLRKFDAPTVYEAIQHHQVTHMCGAPVVLNMLANMSSAKPLEKSVNILTAGAPPPASVLFRIESLGFVVSHGYGLTETGGVCVNSVWKKNWDILSPEERARLKARQGIGSIGMTQVDIVNPSTDEPVRRNGATPGEVVLRGGSVMLGYLKDPEGTSNSTTRTGWFRTGDVGVIHPDGYLEIKDRLKDVIISGGENISSVEVESVLYTHPSVDEVAVVARPDDFWGESPCAFISLKKEGREENVTEKDIIEYCREKLAHYMVPKTVVFQEELPKTSTGKVQKFLLREMAKTMGSLKVISSSRK